MDSAASYIELVQETALAALAGPAGAGILVAAGVAFAALAYSTVSIAARVVGRLVAGRRQPPSPGARARSLAERGAGQAEIARAIGMPRDALAMVLPAELWKGTKLPATAQTSVPTRIRRSTPAPALSAVSR